ncbi:MAG TPA: ATP-binding protein, partial [Anaerolineales bacterium]|nr:ATP-binding protein [Anaerolineales bacterium]
STGQPLARKPLDQKYIDQINQALWIAGLGGVLLALILGLFVARSLTRQIREIANATYEMAQGKLDRKVPVRSKDELGELAQSFNQMSAELAQANQARRQMTADIAHDLRNPLTVIGGYLESLQDGKLQPTPERFQIMQTEVEHLQHLVDDLRTLSLADAHELKLHLQIVAPHELLEQVATTYLHQAEQQRIKLNLDIDSNLPEIRVDMERMEQVLGNLVSNSLRYTLEGGEISLSAKRAEGSLIVSIKDNGSGISAEDLPHIFERSYRGDPSRSGNESGLGLAIAKSIVELHGGKIWAESNADGTKFSILLSDSL